MVADVTDALESLGVKFSIVKGELSDVFWVGSEPPSEEPAAREPASLESGLGEMATSPGGGGEEAGSYSAGQLTVRIRVHNSESGDNTSNLHIDRHAGNMLQFHSFYRDVRNQLAGANGWSQEIGRYTIDVSE